MSLLPKFIVSPSPVYRNRPEWDAGRPVPASLRALGHAALGGGRLHPWRIIDRYGADEPVLILSRIRSGHRSTSGSSCSSAWSPSSSAAVLVDAELSRPTPSMTRPSLGVHREDLQQAVGGWLALAKPADLPSNPADQI